MNKQTQEALVYIKNLEWALRHIKPSTPNVDQLAWNTIERALASRPALLEALEAEQVCQEDSLVRQNEVPAQEASEQASCEQPVAWEDKEDEWSEAIAASHPLQTKSFVEYEAAMKMVGNRKSKGALVDLVCYLLQHFNADTHPHQWQGLTDDEIVKAFNLCDWMNEPITEFARAIEQALKDKST
jgi:hypothetical protein